MKMKKTTLLFLLAAAPAFAAARAELSPDGPLTAGSPARLTVTTDDPSASQPSTPRIAGAEVQAAGTTSRVQIINGEVKRETGFTFIVVPEREGTLEIPAISLGRESTEPLQVAVVRDAAPTARPAPEREKARAFVRLELPKRSLSVGEAVPVTVRAYFRAGTSAMLRGEPKLDSDAFTLSGLSREPAQTEVEVDGERYLQATWKGVLSAAKPMKGKLQVELPVELAYRETSAAPRQRRSLKDLFGGDPFASSFFDDPFFKQHAGAFEDLDSFFDIGQLKRRELTLTGSAGTVTVAGLPEDGRPAAFSGAVGQFELTLAPLPSVPRAGEPLALELRATGTGNFDRLSLNGVPENDDLKVYPVKSSPAADARRGPRIFKQTIVPRRPGTVTVPAFELPYFDPAKGRYAVARTQPLELVVGGTPASQPAPQPLPDVAGAPSVEAPPPEPDQSPVPGTLEPLYRQPRVWALSGIGAAAVGVLALIGALRRSARWEELRRRARLRRAVARRTAELRRAAARRDVHGFFSAARQALQLRLGALWSIAPDAVTAADVSVRLGGRGAGIREVLEQADRASFGSAPSADGLEAWRDRVLAELEALEHHVSPSPTESHT